MAKKNTFQYKVTISVNREQFLNTVVRNSNLSKKELRVLIHLMTHLDSINYKEISKKNIAADLGLTKNDVSDAIKELEYENIIISGSSQSVSKGYKLLF